MKILADFHHEDLFNSLQLLFEKRLGWELYRQIGLEWYTQDFWNVFPHPDTARQYLGTDQATNHPKDIHGNLLPDRSCLNRNYTVEDGIYYICNPTKETIQRAVTLDKFKEMKFDIIISSMPQHIERFNRLISLYQPQAKHIFQVGNAWGHQPGVQHIMASTAPFNVPLGINVCFYHQEFNREVFCYKPPEPRHYEEKSIKSYVHWMRGPEVLQQYKSLLPEYKFTTCGAGMDIDIGRTRDVAAAMHNSLFSWHYKPEGDGYGYSSFTSYAVGRPQVVSANFYQGKLAGALMEDRKTCIDISRRSPHENADLVLYFSDPERHLQMCEAARDRFNQVVNFDYEFENILKPFIDRVLNT